MASKHVYLTWTKRIVFSIFSFAVGRCQAFLEIYRNRRENAKPQPPSTTTGRGGNNNAQGKHQAKAKARGGGRGGGVSPVCKELPKKRQREVLYVNRGHTFDWMGSRTKRHGSFQWGRKRIDFSTLDLFRADEVEIMLIKEVQVQNRKQIPIDYNL